MATPMRLSHSWLTLSTLLRAARPRPHTRLPPPRRQTTRRLQPSRQLQRGGRHSVLAPPQIHPLLLNVLACEPALSPSLPRHAPTLHAPAPSSAQPPATPPPDAQRRRQSHLPKPALRQRRQQVRARRRTQMGSRCALCLRTHRREARGCRPHSPRTRNRPRASIRSEAAAHTRLVWIVGCAHDSW